MSFYKSPARAGLEILLKIERNNFFVKSEVRS